VMRLLLLFVSLIANAEAVSETEVVFYYASSQVETYAPLTQEKLKKNPMYHGVIRGDSAEWLLKMALTPQKKSAFDSESPRLLLYANGSKEPIVVDRYATARFRGEEYFVDPNIFSYLESGLHRGRIPPKADYTPEQWQAIHDMHGRVPAMVESSQENWDQVLIGFVGLIIVAPLLVLLWLKFQGAMPPKD
jgi:hypothetical protein